MGLIQELKLSTDYVLARVDEAQIFTAYFGPFNMKKGYSSPFRRDRHPSCGFYLNRSGKIIFSDLKTGDKWDCFAFVGELYKISYGEAIRKIAQDFGLSGEQGVRFTPPTLSKAETISEAVKKETVIEIIPKPWEPSSLRFWQEVTITEAELKKENVFSVHRLFINGKLIPNYRKENRYALIIPVKRKTGETIYKKIYTPEATDRRFKWISNIPLHIPFGINSLPFKSNTLVVTKALKDKILFNRLFSDVIGTQNESPMALNQKTRTFIQTNYDHVVFNQDYDPAGIASVEHHQQYGYQPLFVPRKAHERYGIKDYADLVKQFGFAAMEKYLRKIDVI